MLIKQRLIGLTVLELLIGLTVIAILAGLAVPGFLSFLSDYRLTSTTETLYNALQYARSEAIKRNTNVYVMFQTGDSWCYGINVGSICNCSNPSSCSLGTYSATNSQTLSLSATGLSSNALYFEGTRGATGVSSTITFTAFGSTPAITIKVTGLGNMQLCSANVSGYQACT